MTPERISELKALKDRVAFTQSQEDHYGDDYCRSARMMAIDGYKHRLFQYADDLLATAGREAKLREAAELLLSVVVDAICRGMPVTQQVADARNKAVAALESKGGES